MAKTTFQNGTIVTPEFLNSIFQTGNGHVHDGGSDDGSAPKVELSAGAHVTGALPRANQIPPLGYLNGFVLTWQQSGDAWNIQISRGHCCMGNADAVASTSGTATKKVINDAGTGFVTWAAGNNQGGVASAVELGATWLHVFVLRKSSDGAIDFGLDTSVTAANLVDATWNQYRRVGSIRTVSLGGGKYGIVKFLQRGDTFLYQNIHMVWASDIAAANDVSTLTLLTPEGVEVQALVWVGIETAVVASLIFWDGLLTSAYNNPIGITIVKSATAPVISDLRLITNTTRNIYATKTSQDAVTVVVFTRGYIDPRGKE